MEACKSIQRFQMYFLNRRIEQDVKKIGKNVAIFGRRESPLFAMFRITSARFQFSNQVFIDDLILWFGFAKVVLRVARF